jgi:D-tyrosyl-tRNA(Tyr) deacylase
MRLVIQRVSSAQVRVSGKVVGKIGKGLFVLVGVKEGDNEKDAEFLAEKLSKIRLMADSDNKINLSLKDTKAGVLIVSQFTLYADTTDGNRPSFIKAADPDKAKGLYEFFIRKLKEKGIKVETGSFGKYMEINTVLDGPVTIIVDSLGL